MDEVALRSLTIAETDYLWGDYPTDQTAPIRGKLRCPVAVGRIDTKACLGSCSDEQFDPCARVIGRLAHLDAVRFPDLPDDPTSQRFGDAISMEFELDPRTRPAINLARGEVRTQAEVVASSARVATSSIYPGRAIRQEIEGRMTLSCQVQADISVICRQTAFDPPEHAAVFEPVAADVGLLLDANSRLPDGSSSAGTRFEWTVDFRLS